MVDSKKKVLRLKQTTDQDVELVQQDNLKRESDRRQVDEAQRSDLKTKLLVEAETR